MEHTAAATGGNGIMLQQANDASPVESSTTTTAVVTDDSKQNLAKVINSIQKTLGILHQLYLTVSSFNVSYQLPLLQRMNNLVSELDNMTRLADNCNIQVPMEVLNLIDDGKNPDEFTRDMLNGCIAKNQITKGKTDAFKGLRRHLIEELDQAFPNEVEAYREIRASSLAGIATGNKWMPNQHEGDADSMHKMCECCSRNIGRKILKNTSFPMQISGREMLGNLKIFLSH